MLFIIRAIHKAEKDVELENGCPRQWDLRVPLLGELGLGASEFRQVMRRFADEYPQYPERVACRLEEVRVGYSPSRRVHTSI